MLKLVLNVKYEVYQRNMKFLKEIWSFSRKYEVSHGNMKFLKEK
jgi:hypothetical protein